MSGARIELELADEVTLGEPIEGHVVVHGPCACEALRVSLDAVIERFDDARDRSFSREVTLSPGAVGAGTTRLPFTIAALRGGETFSGELVRTRWLVRARASTDAGGLRAERPVELRRPEGSPRDARFYGATEPRELSTGARAAIALGLVAAAAGAGAGASVFVAAPDGTVPAAVLASLALLFVAAALATVASLVRAARTPGRQGPWPALPIERGPYYVGLRRPALLFDPRIWLAYGLRQHEAEGGFRGGGTDGLDLVVAAAPACPIEALEAELVVEEVVRVDSRQSAAVRTRALSSSALSLTPSEPGVYAGRVPFPIDAPYTFGAPGLTGVRWRLALMARLRGDPKPWTGDIGLKVVAPGVEASGE